MGILDVHVYVFDTLADWEVGYAIAGINSPDNQVQPGRYRVRVVAPTRAPVRTTGGLLITPDLALSELTPAASAMLILSGGSSWDRGGNAEAVEKARQFLAAGVPVAAICGATAGLASAGLLDDRAHTSNAKAYLEYQKGYGGAAHYRNERVVNDRGLITAGSTFPVDFARAIFEALGLYTPELLAAWYGLFSTGEERYFFAMMEAEQANAQRRAAT